MNMFARRLALTVLLSCGLGAAHADNTPQTLPFAQNWSDTGLIAANDNWSGVPGIEGFRGDGLVAGTAADPQAILAADSPGVIDVNANQTTPNSFTAGGATEFDLEDDVVALAGSGTARAPYLKLYLNTTGASNITVAYRLRDIDGAIDNAVQPVALQFRVGASGDFVNVPAAFVADASSGPSLATLVTPVTASLPAAADNQPLVEVRIITADAAGSDEWIGIDDIAVSAGVVGDDPVLSVTDTSAAEGDILTSPFFFSVNLSQPAGPGGVSFDYASVDGTAQAGTDYIAQTGSATIPEGVTSIIFGIDVNGDTDTEANETFVFEVSNVTGALVGDAQGVGTINNDDVTVIPVHAIQGSGAMSPLVGQAVTTEGIVTGRKSNGFFLQSTDGEGDGNDATSQAVFVFTSSAPPASAAVGNRVQVSGSVVEFIPAADLGQLPLTELGGTVSVNLLSIGNALPAPVVLTPTLLDPAGALDQLEPLEGMRVTADSFTVVAPTGGSTSEPNATGTTNGIFNVVLTGTPRPFREPGIQRPDAPPAGGSIPPIPQWDFNPELLTVVSRGIGGAPLDVAVGQQLSNVVGPLDYGFRRYTIVPDPAVTPTFTPVPTPSAARLPTADEFTVASYNVERFFDTVNDPATDDPVLTAAAFTTRLNKASLAIRNFLNTPDILGVVEMENLSTLQALADKINDDAVAASQPNPEYVAFLQEGNDIGGIDVGFLVKSGEVAAGIDRIDVDAVTQLGKDETWTEPAGGSSLLNDRPPLQLDAVVNYADGRTFPITVIVVHQRSLNGAEEDTANGLRVRAKRQRQAEYLANQIQALQSSDPDRNITVLGDFNAFEFNDGYVDAMNVVTGTPTPDNQTAVAGDGVDLVDPDLMNLFVEEPVDQRYSFVFDGNAQSLDHVLINQALGVAAGGFNLDHARINADFPEIDRNDANSPSRLSDHDPAIAYFAVSNADLAVTASATPANVAPGASMTFNTTVTNDGPNAAAFPGVGFAFDAELADLAVSAPTGWACDAPTVASGTTVVACSVDALANAASAAFQLTAAAPASEAGNAINFAVLATSQTPDPDEDDNDAAASIGVQATADLGFSWSGPQFMYRTTTNATYTARLTNAGPMAAPLPFVVIEIDVPRESVQFAQPQGWDCHISANQTFSIFCDTLSGSAAIGNADFTLTLANPGSWRKPYISFRAGAASGAIDPVNGNNSARERVRVIGVTGF